MDISSISTTTQDFMVEKVGRLHCFEKGTKTKTTVLLVIHQERHFEIVLLFRSVLTHIHVAMQIVSTTKISHLSDTKISSREATCTSTAV